MDFISYNISKLDYMQTGGRYIHVFRTDEYLSIDIEHIEAMLVEKFPESEGYRVTKRNRPNTSTETELT